MSSFYSDELEEKKLVSMDSDDNRKTSLLTGKPKKKPETKKSQMIKKAQKAWNYSKNQMTKLGPPSVAMIGEGDLDPFPSMIAGLKTYLSNFRYSDVAFTRPDKDASKLLSNPEIQNVFARLIDFVNSAIVTSGCTHLETGGFFNNKDVYYKMAVFWDAVSDAEAPYPIEVTFILMKKILQHFKGKQLAAPNQVFPEWMWLLDRGKSFKQGKATTYKYTDGLKVLLFASYLMSLPSDQNAATALVPLTKLIKEDLSRLGKYEADLGGPLPKDTFGNLCFHWTAAMHLFGSVLMGTSVDSVTRCYADVDKTLANQKSFANKFLGMSNHSIKEATYKMSTNGFGCSRHWMQHNCKTIRVEE